MLKQELWQSHWITPYITRKVFSSQPDFQLSTLATNSRPFHTNLLVFSSPPDYQLTTNQSQSQSYFTTGGLLPIHLSWRQAPWYPLPEFLFSKWTLAVTVIMQQPPWWRDGSVVYNCCWFSIAQSFSGPSPAGLMTIFYCLSRDSPNLERQVPIFISPRNRVVRLYVQALGSLFVSDYLPQTVPVITSRNGLTENTVLLLLCLDLLPERCVYYNVPLLVYHFCVRVCCCGKSLPSYCLETALVYLLISLSLHSNDSTRYSI
jgi:hypothetical protein